MTGRVQTLRSNVTGNRPPGGHLPGELYVNWADGQLGVVNASSVNQDLIPVTFFSTTANYSVGNFVVQAGQLYRATQAITAGAFNAAQWTQVGGSVSVSDTLPTNPQPGGLWWDSVGGNLYVYYNDGNSTQWVPATNLAGAATLTVSGTVPTTPKAGDMWFDSVGGQLYIYFNDGNSLQWVIANNFSGGLPLSGGTMTGPLVLASDATQPLNPVSLQQLTAMTGYRNRIINGDMSVDQRNGGALVAAPIASSRYALDRWKVSINAATPSRGNIGQSGTVVTAGFTYALEWATTTVYTPAAADGNAFFQAVEGYNWNDAFWGTANAQPVVLEFWAYSSLTGTFAGALNNGAGNRSYVFAYAITAASTWQKFRIAIPGDTAGTWNVAGNAVAVYLQFNLGTGANQSTTPGAWVAGGFVSATGAVNIMGTLNAYLYITGVALMVGQGAANAEPEFRKYSDNLLDCMRYFQQGHILTGFYMTVSAAVYASSMLSPPMRSASPGLTTTVNQNNNLTGYTLNNQTYLVYATGTATTTGGVIINVNFIADADF